MCGKKPAAPPAVVQRDPVAEQAEADAKAKAAADAETATRRRRRAWSASLTSASMRSAGNLGGGSAPSSLIPTATPGGG